MRWFKLPKRKPKKDKESAKLNGQNKPRFQAQQNEYTGPAPRSNFTTILPDKVLERIFAFVCPHAEDESYEDCESSSVGEACPLCDLRDIAHCAQVSKKWRGLAPKVM